MKATPETSLATTHPEIAAMWHPTKTVMPPHGIPKQVQVSGAGGNAKRTQVTFGNSVQIK